MRVGNSHPRLGEARLTADGLIDVEVPGFRDPFRDIWGIALRPLFSIHDESFVSEATEHHFVIRRPLIVDENAEVA
jgi:hypothetical protein